MCVSLVWKRRCADVRAGTQAPPLRFRLGRLRVGDWCRWGGLRVNGYLVCVGLRGKILRRWVGAVPVCPPVSPSRGVSIVHLPRTMHVFFVMEMPLRGRSGGHAGAAPTVSFGWIGGGRLIPFGQITCGWLVSCGWLMSFGWIAYVILFVCWENGAHEPTPSVLYFCQPRVD